MKLSLKKYAIRICFSRYRESYMYFSKNHLCSYFNIIMKELKLLRKAHVLSEKKFCCGYFNIIKKILKLLRKTQQR